MRAGLQRAKPIRGGGGSPDNPRAADAFQHRLDEACRQISRLREEVFLLQEQNQQLRRDLATAVCPRICARPFRSAS